jgi:phosphatidylglycerophosphatase B
MFMHFLVSVLDVPYTCDMKRIVFLFAGTWILMSLVVLQHSVPFSAVKSHDILSRIALLFTETAGKIGTAIIVILTVLIYTRRMSSDKQVLKTFLRSSVLLFLLIGGFAFINEHLTKKATRVIRPSLQYISETTGGDFKPETLYQFESSERSAKVVAAISQHRTSFHSIDQNVLNHWSDETGYSFPSGHTFNAFLLATIISFSLFHSRSKNVVAFYFIPPIWAMFVGISRVALGAHSALDVIFGGAIGLIAGLVFIHWDDLRHLVLHRKYNV